MQLSEKESRQVGESRILGSTSGLDIFWLSCKTRLITSYHIQNLSEVPKRDIYILVHSKQVFSLKLFSENELFYVHTILKKTGLYNFYD